MPKLSAVPLYSQQFRIVFIITLLALILFIQVAPAQAATWSFSSITSLVGDCTTILGIRADFSLGGTTDDSGTGQDYVNVVVYDGNNQPFAYIGIWVAVGFSTTLNNFGWNYPFVNSPATRFFTIRVYDNPNAVTTASGDIVGAQNGPIISQTTFDPALLGNCTHLPLAGQSTITSLSVAPIVEIPPDSRINWKKGDSMGVIYAGGNGISVYAVNGSNANVVASISADQVPVDCPPENTLLASSADGRFAIFKLSSCEYQVNMGPDGSGKVFVTVFTGLPPTNIYHYEYFGGPPGTVSASSNSNAPPPITVSNVTNASGQTYTIQAGDTLFSIARRFGVDLNTLAQTNGIDDPTRIFVGQVLTIP